MSHVDAIFANCAMFVGFISFGLAGISKLCFPRTSAAEVCGHEELASVARVAVVLSIGLSMWFGGRAILATPGRRVMFLFLGVIVNVIA